MSLDSKTRKAILDLVYRQPRTIDEISKHISKNWRTADRYIAQIFHRIFRNSIDWKKRLDELLKVQH